jgi:hypothetical protein
MIQSFPYGAHSYFKAVSRTQVTQIRGLPSSHRRGGSKSLLNSLMDSKNSSDVTILAPTVAALPPFGVGGWLTSGLHFRAVWRGATQYDD